MSSVSDRAVAAGPGSPVVAGGSWTHRLARIAVRPLVGTAITPNHLTTVRLVTGLMACGGFALGRPEGDLWGGILWVLSAFLDRADGELARIGGKTSAWGHLYDYVCDNACTALFFISIGVGMRGEAIGSYAVALGVLAGGSILASNIFSEAFEKADGSGHRAYAGAGGFDLDDLLYLMGPAAWLGWLWPILVGAAIVSPIMALLTFWRLQRLKRRP
jgi:archaetidylinositol phosphate synthase